MSKINSHSSKILMPAHFRKAVMLFKQAFEIRTGNATWQTSFRSVCSKAT
ncbi:hypothetical protein SC499_14840 [Peribacillus simplex]|nr:hypothetical protein [Peribacillus simplex]MDW7615968.1 hypothetical protein [Peribacillus simplex]